MEKRYLLVVLVLLVVFISGCNDDPVSIGAFVGGSDGVDISFVEGAPLSEFTQGQEIPVSVLLKNNGEDDIAENLAEVQLYGLPFDEYGLDDNYKKVEGQLRGIKKDFLEEGGEQVISMGTLKYNREVSGFTDKQLFARVCYPYKTKAVVTSCATSKNIDIVEETSVCDVEGEKIISGGVSSGPIQVTSFTEQLSGSSSVSFKLVIANSGIGDVYAFDSVCSSLSDPVTLAAKKEMVKLTVSPSDINCNFVSGESNVGFVKVGIEPKNVICTMNIDGSSSYERDIDIELDYKYVEDISVNIKILEA